MWFFMIVLLAEVGGAPAPAPAAGTVQSAYRKLTADQLSAKKIETPPKDAQRIDVSERIRSASFGHKTWLLVAPDGKQFWVEYGASTNSKAALFGPFPVTATAPSGTTPSGTSPSGTKVAPPPPVLPPNQR
ncbi:MAG: hypothetical protein ACXVCV_02890 [Polyangia bacterium]